MQQTMFAIASIGFLLSCLAGQPMSAQDGDALTPVPFQQNVAELTPSNTMIQFIGAHTGDEPNPRIGHFQKFVGQARLDSTGSTLESITVEIQTESLTTPIPNLTNHLKSPDFLDAREYPTAKFQTTRIAPLGDPNQVEVTGELTLHGSSASLVFPATITIDASGVSLQANVTIDRTEFGMGLLTDRVEKEVDLNLAIGRPAPSEAPENPGRRNFDPMAFFRQRDADKDGILAGSELTDRLQESLADFDTDNDGAISQAEFETRLQTIAGGRGRRGGDGRRSDNE